MEVKIHSVKEFDLKNKKVLFRPDINSPIDPQSKMIVNANRIQKNAPTLKYLLDNGAAVAIIAHQGDTLDYQNLIPMKEHAAKLSEAAGYTIQYIDDVCGDAALEAVNNLKSGECILLGNLRYLTEEVSTFEKDVKLTPEEMKDTYLIRRLAPLFDLYVNDAFSAAHRNCPSMTGFQQVLPSAAGFQFFDEITALSAVRDNARHPAVFVLGGAKISDAFGMMETVLKNGSADKILTTGITGIIMLIASGIDVGAKMTQFLKDKDLLVFVEDAKKYLAEFPGKIEMPVDVAIKKDDARAEVPVSQMPLDTLYPDIGSETVIRYALILKTAGTIFANGPAGVYEDSLFADGTRGIWQAIADSDGYSVIGGGDTVSSATKFIDIKKISYVCTAGGALIRFMSGKKLPLVDAMEKAYGGMK